MDKNEALQLIAKALDTVVCNGPDRRRLDLALQTLQSNINPPTSESGTPQGDEKDASA